MKVCDKCKKNNNLEDVAFLKKVKGLIGEQTKTETIATLCPTCRYDLLKYIQG